MHQKPGGGVRAYCTESAARRSAIASFVQSLLAIGMASRNTCSVFITLPEIGDYIIREFYEFYYYYYYYYYYRFTVR